MDVEQLVWSDQGGWKRISGNIPTGGAILVLALAALGIYTHYPGSHATDPPTASLLPSPPSPRVEPCTAC